MEHLNEINRMRELAGLSALNAEQLTEVKDAVGDKFSLRAEVSTHPDDWKKGENIEKDGPAVLKKVFKALNPKFVRMTARAGDHVAVFDLEGTKEQLRKALNKAQGLDPSEEMDPIFVQALKPLK